MDYATSKNKHNLCIVEACEQASHIQKTEQIKTNEYTPLLNLRRMNLWWDGNPWMVANDIQDYS